MKKPLVALAMPMSGRSIRHDGAAEAFFLRPTLKGVDRLLFRQGTSMLTRCFNMLWCDALNARELQPGITHFAMIHDDVAPDSGWLDVMLEEIEATGADMVSAVIPIKDFHGLTSTAIDMGDPWLVRRLCMKEVFNLPETFEAKDVPWAKQDSYLLPNTGLFLCRFDQPWVERLYFQFLNKIQRMPDGQFASKDIPEDWDFGRQLHALGKKVVCTRKVKINHEQGQWHNRCVWGDWPTDLAYLEYQRQESGAALDTSWRFPAEIDGWLTKPEGEALARISKDKAVLEIGSYCGKSSICIAQTAESLFAVHPFDSRGTTTPGRDTLCTFLENVTRYGVLPKITVHQGISEMIVPEIDKSFDLVFIDGAHDKKSVLRDVELAMPKLKSDGLLAFHDYGPGDPGVVLAVDSLVNAGASIVEKSESIAVIRPAIAA